jgi:hypothetical protein
MMKMYLDFAPTCPTVLRQAVDQGRIVLFCGVEVGMSEGSAIVVRPFLHSFRIFVAPSFEPLLLYGPFGTFSSSSGQDRRFEVVRQTD